MDEITSDLDLFAREGILNFLRAECEVRGATIFYCFPSAYKPPLCDALGMVSLCRRCNAAIVQCDATLSDEAHTSLTTWRAGPATCSISHRAR